MIPYGNDSSNRQLFHSETSGLNYNPIPTISVHGTNLQALERTPGDEIAHTGQGCLTDPFPTSFGTSAGTQLPAIDSFDLPKPSYDSQFCHNEARFPMGNRNLVRADHALRSKDNEMSALQGSMTDETKFSRILPGSNQPHTDSSGSDVNIGNRTPVPAIKSRARITSLAAPEEKVKQLSKNLASEITKYINQVSPEELQLIIQTRVLSLFSSTSSGKRTSDDAGLDNSTESIGKRVTCSVCPKIMDRPCDIK